MCELKRGEIAQGGFEPPSQDYSGIIS
jgi:hypothetical protein